MSCPSCGKEIPDGSTFCLHCGKPIAARAAASPTGSRSTKWLLILAAIVAVIAIVVVALQNSMPTSTSPQPVTEKLTSGQLVVRAGSYIYVKFNVDPARMQNARVIGSFRASGGSGNDIQVVLAEESEFENWKNGHTARLLYSTEKTTTGKIDVPITEAGTYYLIFNNAFSALSDKDVFAEVSLHYLTPP